MYQAKRDSAAAVWLLLALEQLVVLLGRFVSGRPMLREVGPADSTYTEWADLDGARLARRMRVAVPRSRWGRRPGWHRQAVRLTALALTVAFLAVPVITAAALTGAIVTGLVGWFASIRRPNPEREDAAWPRPLHTLHDSFSPRASARWDAVRVRPVSRSSYEPLQRPAPVYAQAERLDQGGVR